jgi:hypothetical protein
MAVINPPLPLSGGESCRKIPAVRHDLEIKLKEFQK